MIVLFYDRFKKNRAFRATFYYLLSKKWYTCTCITLFQGVITLKQDDITYTNAIPLNFEFISLKGTLYTIGRIFIYKKNILREIPLEFFK